MNEKELIDQLARLGGEHDKLTEQLEGVRADLKPLIVIAAKKGIPQVKIADLTGYTRESIRKMCLPAERAAKEQEVRRTRRKK